MKNINGQQLIQLFEEWAPKEIALEGDRIGLQIGTLNKPIYHVMTALDVTHEVVEEAISKRIDLIIAHHPVIFHPLKKIDTSDAGGKLVEKLIKHDIIVYAAHTNLDVANGGVNDMLANILRLQNVEVLIPTYEKKLRKLVVYTPHEHADEMVQGLGEAGAGTIGDYSYCSFTSEGMGRFIPGDGSQPHIGDKGKLTEVAEVKIEVIYPLEIEKKVLSKMLKVHPYEEPAYDIFDLQIKGEELGLGRIGFLEEEVTLAQLSHMVKEAFDSKGVRLVGDSQAKIKKVAVLGGDGNKYFRQAKFKGADVYITGDIYYHTAHDALNIGLNMIDPGHYSEKIMKNETARYLQKLCDEKGFNIKVVPSVVDTDPFKFI